MPENLHETAHWDGNRREVSGSSRGAWLTILTGTDAGRVYPIEGGDITIGRSSDADIVLDDPQVSRIHTRLELGPGSRATISDCQSTNGTMIGSRQVHNEPRELRDGDKLQIAGAVVLRFSFKDRLEEHFERKLYDSATRDGLTGLFNKQHFLERLHQEHTHSVRYDRSFALVLLDIDDFKRVNDTFGHAAGDHVLCEIATAVAQTLRGDELLARFGGEEFILLLRKADLREGLHVAERLRREVESLAIHWEGERVPVTASFGVTSTSSKQVENPTRLFVEADECLYRAKRAGKNRVCGTG